MKRILIKAIIGCLIMCNTQSCSQKKETMDKNAIELLGSLYKDVQYMDRQISNHAVVSSGGATVEVYINDFPIHREAAIVGKDGRSGGSNPINKYILKSGEQNWEVRVYPAYNTDATQQKKLAKGARFTVRLEKLRFTDVGIDNLADPIILIDTPLEYDTSGTGNTEEYYKDAGKPMMVYKGKFSAEVPYNLKGWSESVDLSKEDQKVLQAQAVEKYRELWKMLDKRETGKFAENILKREKETSQALFYTKILNDDYMEAFFDRVDKQGKKMKPLENYKMVFSGNKMVTLESTD